MLKFHAAGFAGLFLLLSCAVIPLAESPKGHYVWIASAGASNRIPTCYDGTWYYLRLKANGNAVLNGSEMSLPAADQKLQQVLGQKVERVLYLQAERDVPFQSIVSFIDKKEKDLRPLYIAILTDKVDAQMMTDIYPYLCPPIVRVPPNQMPKVSDFRSGLQP